MRRIFTLVSIAIHSIVIALVFFAQVLDVGALPMPRDLFPSYMDVSIVNPPIPPAPRPPSPVKPADRPAAPNTAPVEAPNGVTKETGRESERIERTDPGLVGGVETGGASDFGVIGGSAIVPPPPPPVTPTQPVRLHVGIEAPRKIVDVQPDYPTIARIAHQQGIVILDTVIDAHGQVESVRVLKGFSTLNQAAIDAVKQWRFTPALLNGQPIPVVMTVTVNFVLALP